MSPATSTGLYKVVKELLRARHIHDFRPAVTGPNCGICGAGRESLNHPGPNETCRAVREEAYRLGHEAIMAADKEGFVS